MKFSRMLKERKIDVAMLIKEDLKYFLGHESDGVLALFPDGGKILLASRLEASRTRELNRKELDRLTRGKTVGLNFQKCSVAFFKSVKAKRKIDISGALGLMRAVKSKREIMNIMKACEFTDRCFSEIIDGFSYRNEKEIEDKIYDFAREHELGMAFEPIIASGKNSSIPHYRKNDAKIGKGFLTLDFGFVFNGYVSDMTRTVYVGKASAIEKDIYNKVLRAMDAGIAAIRVGGRYSAADEAARKALGKEAAYFIHSLGHGIGIEVHESPSLHSKSKDKIEANNVVTIEPGIYLPGRFGVRIEDDVLVGKRLKILTKSRKSLIEC